MRVYLGCSAITKVNFDVSGFLIDNVVLLVVAGAIKRIPYHLISSLHYTDVIMDARASQITQIKENIKAPRGLPAQMAIYAENVSIWWRHHDDTRSRWPVELVVIHCILLFKPCLKYLFLNRNFKTAICILNDNFSMPCLQLLLNLLSN